MDLNSKLAEKIESGCERASEQAIHIVPGWSSCRPAADR